MLCHFLVISSALIPPVHLSSRILGFPPNVLHRSHQNRAPLWKDTLVGCRGKITNFKLFSLHCNRFDVYWSNFVLKLMIFRCCDLFVCDVLNIYSFYCFGTMFVCDVTKICCCYDMAVLMFLASVVAVTLVQTSGYCGNGPDICGCSGNGPDICGCCGNGSTSVVAVAKVQTSVIAVSMVQTSVVTVAMVQTSVVAVSMTLCSRNLWLLWQRSRHL